MATSLTDYIAGLYAAATEVMHRRGEDAPWPWRSGVYAVAAVAALALALTIVLEKGWLTIALALMCPALAWISTARPLPNLRYLAAGLAATTTARNANTPMPPNSRSLRLLSGSATAATICHISTPSMAAAIVPTATAMAVMRSCGRMPEG